MDLLPTGSDSKIFEVKTNEVHVIMKGKNHNLLLSIIQE